MTLNKCAQSLIWMANDWRSALSQFLTCFRHFCWFLPYDYPLRAGLTTMEPKPFWIRNWIFHFWIWQNLRKKSCQFYKLFSNCSIFDKCYILHKVLDPICKTLYVSSSFGQIIKWGGWLLGGKTWNCSFVNFAQRNHFNFMQYFATGPINPPFMYIIHNGDKICVNEHSQVREIHVFKVRKY